jgi:dTDP-4-dehydrorhamnose 3,5-epimerase-like enzyme
MVSEVIGKQLNSNAQQQGVIFKDIQRFGDDRGDFTNISLRIEEKITFKRSYIVTNNQQGVVRAFHGHKKEGKLFYVPKGAFKFIIIHMTTNEWKEYTLLASVPKILYVPPGYYNGFVSLTPAAILITFSTLEMEDSMNDDYRQPYDILGKDVWSIKNR